MQRESRQPGFYSVELFVTLSVLGLMMTVAVPSYLEKKQESRACQLAEAFRTWADVIQTFANEHGEWPLQDGRTEVPNELGRQLLLMRHKSPDGTYWEYEFDQAAGRPGLSLVAPQIRSNLIERMDRILDDGNPETGILVAGKERITMRLERKPLP